MKLIQKSEARTCAAINNSRRQIENSTTIINAIFAGLLSLCVLAQQAFGFVSATPGQEETISVGVFEFQNESGSNLPTEFTRKIARELAQKLNANHKDLLARQFNPASNASSIKGMSVEQLGALGKQQGVKFIIRGGLLSASDESSGSESVVTYQLYADVVSVEALGVRSIRSEGSGAGKDQALSNAIAQLAASIHQTVSATAPEPSAPVEPPQAPADASEQGESKDVIAAESDEELLQLIAQAESLAEDGAAGNTGNFATLSQALAALKAALKSKASLLEEGKDTAIAEQEIAAQRERLQASISALTQDERIVESEETQDEQPGGEKKNVLARINEYAGEALSIIQKIQEMRAALRGESVGGYENESLSPDPTSETGIPTEEPTEELSGVVTEMGEPVAGVTVTEPESGASASTDSNGSYVLQGVPAKRLARLVLVRSGKQIATGQIPVARGRASIADFELKPQTTGALRPALRIIPSTVQVARKNMGDGNVGMVKGIIRDAKGRPLARALVNLKGFAMARTDSEGRYLIRGVPPGAHQLIVYRSGLKPRTETVRVAAKKSSESNTQFAVADKITRAKNRQPLFIRGSGTVLRGAVLDGQKRPLAGAKITVVQQASALSVVAGQKGTYLLRDLKPGSYRVLVSKAGYDEAAQTVTLQPGETGSRDFQLKKKDSVFIEKAIQARQKNQNPGARDDRDGRPTSREIQTGNNNIGAKETRPSQSGRERLQNPLNDVRTRKPASGNVELKKGQLKGRILDARTSRAVPGVIVSIAGQRAITTDAQGFYSFDGLSAGAHQVIARKSDFLDSITSLTIRPGETTTAVIRLNPKPRAPSGNLRTGQLK